MAVVRHRGYVLKYFQACLADLARTVRDGLATHAAPAVERT